MGEYVLDTRIKLPGESHPQVVDSMGNLALTYEAQSRYKDAQVLLLRAIEITNAALGEEHTATLT